MARKFFNGIDVVNNRIVNLASPSSATDAVNKTYVDNLVNGLSWKQAVDVATTTAHTLATDFAAGQVIDGITLVAGMRVLVKNQATASENGIYIVPASGAPSRSADGVTGELNAASTVLVMQGTTNADTTWTLATTGTITVGTTNQSWVQSNGSGGGGGTYTAGNGLTLTGSQFNVVPGLGILADGTSTRIDPAHVPLKYAANIGNGSSTSITVTHGLNTLDVVTTIYNVSTGEVVDTDITNATTTTITLTFATAPASNAYRVVCHG